MDATLEATIRGRIDAEKARTAPPAEAIPVPLIPTERYTDPAFHELERERVFARTWLFVGHESEWPEPGAYRLMTRSGAPIVVVRGDDGVLRAFYNACRHRGAPVTRDECGTARRLTCQYHSWSYGTDGTLKAVPDARSFVGARHRGPGARSGALRDLGRAGCSSTRTSRPSPLIEFLGPMADQMAEIDGPAMRAVGTQVHHLDCNWKLMVDAFLEVYHVRTVHPDNAALLYDDQSVTVTMLPNGHSRLTVEKHEDVPRPPHGLARSTTTPRCPLLWRQTSTSFGIFPNLVVPMDTGAFTFLCMWPTSVTTTELELRWYAPAWAGDDVPQEHLDRMDALRDRHGPGQGQHGAHPGIDLLPGRPAVPARLARAAHPPLRAGRRPGHRARRPAARHRRVRRPRRLRGGRRDRSPGSTESSARPAIDRRTRARGGRSAWRRRPARRGRCSSGDAADGPADTSASRAAPRAPRAWRAATPTTTSSPTRTRP